MFSNTFALKLFFSGTLGSSNALQVYSIIGSFFGLLTSCRDGEFELMIAEYLNPDHAVSFSASPCPCRDAARSSFLYVRVAE